MTLEIEAKVKVDSFEALLTVLRQKNAQSKGLFRQIDTYFFHRNRDVLQSGCGLRLRCQQQGGQTRFFLTFKGPRQNSPYKSRAEWETAVDDGAAMQAILKQLGFAVGLIVDKHRQEWSFMDCLVCLDQVANLGCFVEIEGQNEQSIGLVLQTLGISQMPIVKQGYAELLSEQKSITPPQGKPVC